MGGFGVLPTATPSPTLNPQPTPTPTEYLIQKYKLNFTSYGMTFPAPGFMFRNDEVVPSATAKIQFVSAYPGVQSYLLWVQNSTPIAVHVNYGNDYRLLAPNTDQRFYFDLGFDRRCYSSRRGSWLKTANLFNIPTQSLEMATGFCFGII
jgi:hypothetical protein